jgi:hypothetical protein
MRSARQAGTSAASSAVPAISVAAAIASSTVLTARYNDDVITWGIRGFVARDWEAVRRSKDAYWAARIRCLGPGEALRVADELRRQVRLRNPDWPDASLRQADLAAHVRLAERLRRAGATRRA